MMKESICMEFRTFTSHRMVAEYNERYYKTATESYSELLDDNAKQAEILVQQHKRLDEKWKHISVSQPSYDIDMGKLHVGDTFNITTDVHLGELNPEEVDVEVYYGPVNSELTITNSKTSIIKNGEDLGDGNYRYNHKLVCEHSGRYAFNTRVTPKGNRWNHIMPGFITWAGEK